MDLPKKVLVKWRSQIVAKKPWHLNPQCTVPPSDTQLRHERWPNRKTFPLKKENPGTVNAGVCFVLSAQEFLELETCTNIPAGRIVTKTDTSTEGKGFSKVVTATES